MLAELEKVSKAYEQPGTGIKNLVLDQVSLSVSENETIAITGPSGSGKSTLLNLLGTLDRPTSGRIVLDGTDVSSADDKMLAGLRTRLIGHIFQLHYLLPQLTLLENVLIPVLARNDKWDKSATHRRALGLIERVGLSERIHHFPYMMSVGECQRAAVVRALINEPRMILADEPTGSLDAVNAVELGKLLVEINQEMKTALVVVTHSPALATLMQKKYRLLSGRLQTWKEHEQETADLP